MNPPAPVTRTLIFLAIGALSESTTRSAYRKSA
jgi:hypothetical protein